MRCVWSRVVVSGCVVVACMVAGMQVASGQGGPRAAAISCGPLYLRGLVSYWAGNGNANDVAGRNNGTVRGGVSFVSGPHCLGRSFHFNGVNGYVRAPSVGLPTGNSDRTLALWAKIDSFDTGAQEGFFAGYGNFGTFNQVFLLGVSSVPGNHTVFWSQWGGRVSGPNLPTGQWNFIAATYRGANRLLTLYLNGREVGKGTSPPGSVNTASGTQFYMGRIAGSLGDQRRLAGAVDDVMVYNRALTSAGLIKIFDAGRGL